MKLTPIRWLTLLLILSLLVIAALVQYISTEKNTPSNAVFVMANNQRTGAIYDKAGISKIY